MTSGSSSTEGASRFPMLSDVLGRGNILQCDCGSSAFFDWGLRVLIREDIGQSQRMRNLQWSDNIAVCAMCHTPYSLYSGTWYNATEYVSKEEVERLIKYGQSREHSVSLKSMDD